MKAYTVEYRMYEWSTAKKIVVPAKTKWEAYEKACWEVIPEIEKFSPYSVEVVAVTYNNGNYKTF